MALAAPALSLQTEIDAAAADTSGRWSPGRNEAWWWLGIPLAVAVSLLVIYRVSPLFYKTYILPEGYGVLEVSHFFVPFTASLICFGLLFRPFVKSWPLVYGATLLFAVACFYIAGEEHSWGQHFFKWETPEYWAELNRQKETNLHNTAHIFNQIPEKVLQFGILIGGILLPLIRRATGGLKHWLLELFVPPLALLPVSLGALFYYIANALIDEFGIALVQRPSEAAETFYYLFLLFYVIVYRRRLTLLEERRSGG